MKEQAQTVSYYKDNNRITRFTKETGELLHIFNNDPELSLSIQIVEESQREIMPNSLSLHANESTAEIFNAELASVKAKINSL